MAAHLLTWRKQSQRGIIIIFTHGILKLPCINSLSRKGILITDCDEFLARRQDSSIGFGARVRANMRTGGVTTAAITSSLLETVKNCPF